jgi:hypothetical protein
MEEIWAKGLKSAQIESHAGKLPHSKASGRWAIIGSDPKSLPGSATPPLKLSINA